MAPPILIVDIKWRVVVYFSPGPLYHRERARLPIEYLTVWNPEPVWTFGEEKYLLPFPGFKPLDFEKRNIFSPYRDSNS
jgi:hypothetical protein